MADSSSGSEGASRPPFPKPEARRSGFLPPPINKTSSTDRVVVTLSSVAKTPPPATAAAGSAVAPPKKLPTFAPSSILSAKETVSKMVQAPALRPPQLNRTMKVKLPEKTGVLPKLTSLSNMPISPVESKSSEPATPAPVAKAPATIPASLSAKAATTTIPASARTAPLASPAAAKPPVTKPEPAPAHQPPPLPAAGTRAPALKLKPLQVGASAPGESIFASDETKESPGAAKLHQPREISAPSPASADAIARAPVLRDDGAVKPAAGLLPPPLPPVDKPEPLHVAPPLVNHGKPDAVEKHRLPAALRKADVSSLATPPRPPEPAGAKAVPPLIEEAIAKGPATPASHATPTSNVPKDAPAARVYIGAIPPPAEASTAQKILDRQTPSPLSSPNPETIAQKSALPISSASSGPAATTLKESLAAARQEAVEISRPLPKPDSTSIKKAPPARAPRELPFFAGLFARRRKPVSLTGEKSQPARKIAATPPISPAAAAIPLATGAALATAAASSRPPPAPKTSAPPTPDKSAASAAARSARVRKKQIRSTIAFYVLFIGVMVPLLYVLGIHFSSETRVEGQVIPPAGMMLSNEVWVVSDFSPLATSIADDLANDRAPKIQLIQERQDHVQRAQADIAAREERIRLLSEQVQAAKDEITAVIKQAHDAAQKVWDGPGAELEDQYKSKLAQLGESIASRARTLNLKYAPDPTYQSPEVWANAYRLSLYQTPPGVDGVKEHQWIEDQIKAWRAYTQVYDASKEKLRLQAAQIQLSPSAQVADVNGKIIDLQHRIDSTEAEEEPLKTELQRAQTDLAAAQATEASLDDKYYQQLYALPESSITKRLPLMQNGRFTWPRMENDSAFSQSDRTHSYWIFARAIRQDGRQYWVLDHFSISQNSVVAVLIEPTSFLSTKAILRPDLSPEEQQK